MEKNSTYNNYELDSFGYEAVEAEFNYGQVAEYIVKTFPTYKLSEKDAKSLAKQLLDNNWKVSEILSGKANEVIKYILVSRDSVVPIDFDENEDMDRGVIPIQTTTSRRYEHRVPLKPRKKAVNKAGVALLLAAALSVCAAGVAAVYKDEIKEQIEIVQTDNQVNQSLGMLASTPGSYDYENRLSIVEQNSDNFNSNGAADSALDIIKIVETRPELLDITLANVFFGLKDNQLANMDAILSYLKEYASENPNLGELSTKLEGYTVYLEYLMDLGLIDPNDEQTLNDLKTAIAIYKVYASRNESTNLDANFKTPHGELDHGNKQVVNGLIEAYEIYYGGLKEEQVDGLVEAANNGIVSRDYDPEAPGFGGRS